MRRSAISSSSLASRTPSTPARSCRHPWADLAHGQAVHDLLQHEPRKNVSICSVTPSPNSSTESASAALPAGTRRDRTHAGALVLIAARVVFIMVKLAWLPPSPPTITPPFCSRRLRRRSRRRGAAGSRDRCPSRSRSRASNCWQYLAVAAEHARRLLHHAPDPRRDLGPT